MHGHTGGGHVGGGHMPPAHHQPHQAHHHQVHHAVSWNPLDSHPRRTTLATRIRNPRMAAYAAGITIALVILLLIFL